MAQQDITEALRECNAYARKGYALADREYEKLHQELEVVQERLRHADHNQKKLSRLANDKLIQQQMAEIQKDMELDKVLQKDLAALRRRQEEFSVVVFGRTMAGKSTLMEILTHGNGESIGKGAQRTTRDVRSYRWQGMKITDVPGIGAFSGAEDEEVAMEAAKSADLILFLITDDAPQQVEAQKLAELKGLGKAVLGIVNVKLGLNLVRRTLALRQLQKKLSDRDTLDELRDQFRAFAPQWQQDWTDIPFVYTHLRAAYLADAQREDDPELLAASNFGEVERFILDRVQRDGRFYRWKTPLDVVARPMQERMEKLLADSCFSIQAALRYRRKAQLLSEWKQEYIAQVRSRFSSLAQRIDYEMAQKIAEFSAIHYNDRQAEAAWLQEVSAMQLDARWRRFLEEEVKICDNKRRELADELRTEIHFTGGREAQVGGLFLMDTTSYGSVLNVGGALAPLLFTGPMGIALALGAGLLSWMTDSKSVKIRQAQQSLRSQLETAMQPYTRQFVEKVAAFVNQTILQEGIDGFRETLLEMDNLLFYLAEQQQQGAMRLAGQLDEVEGALFQSALQYVREDEQATVPLRHIARIPGEYLAVFSPEKLSPEDVERMEKLLEEEIQYVLLPKDSAGDEETLRNFGRSLLQEEWAFQDYSYGLDEERTIRTWQLPAAASHTDIKERRGVRIVMKLLGDPLLLAERGEKYGKE